jgi:hypothetical protein
VVPLLTERVDSKLHICLHTSIQLIFAKIEMRYSFQHCDSFWALYGSGSEYKANIQGVNYFDLGLSGTLHFLELELGTGITILRLLLRVIIVRYTNGRFGLLQSLGPFLLHPLHCYIWRSRCCITVSLAFFPDQTAKSGAYLSICEGVLI